MPDVNDPNANQLAAKVMDWCAQLAAISALDNGISRFYLTSEHARCNQWVARWMELVATVGQIECGPGAVNGIPGRARFSLDIRSGHDPLRNQAVARIQQEFSAICAACQLNVSWKEIHNAPPSPAPTDYRIFKHKQ